MLALCCSCVEEIEPYGDLAEPQPLVFTASQGDMTFSTRAAADGTWEGDGTEFVAIQVGSKVKKYKVTSSDGTLEPVDSDNTFYRSDKNNIEISAWYPYKDNQLSQPSKPNILIDQSNKANREASNLMTATATAKFGETTSLEFKHQTARLRLLLYGEDDKPLAAGATVKFSGSTTWITAYNEGNGYYSALLAPLTISKGANFLQIITSVGTYKAKTPAEITLTAGQNYEFSYSLKRDLVNTSGIEVTLSETELEYSGNAQTPTVSVKYNGTELIQGTDYTLAWSNSSSNSIGSYTVTVTGKGAYIGTVEKTYSIVKAPPYLTFTANSAQTFTMTLPTDATAAASIGTFEYSVGGGTWTKVTSGMSAVSFGGTNGNLRLRGTGLNTNKDESLLGTAYSGGKYSTISFGTTASVAASGDIRTLINGKGYATVSTSSAKFCYLFKGCTVLTSSPDLPATDLAEQCYQGMFQGCTSLTTAPNIPVEKFADYCCQDMFSGCEKLKSAPTMTSAKTLGRYCCYNMFKGCTALETAPALPATTLEECCYMDMFSGCKKLKSAPDLSAQILAEKCYLGMFEGCTSLTATPELNAKNIADGCYYNMFSDCTSLTEGPKTLPATTLATSCYARMFEGCTNLTTVPILPAETLAPNCYQWMFQNCTSLEIAPALPAMTLASQCYQYMFKGCTALTSAPDLPATNLNYSYCYSEMFKGCTSLKSVTIKATSISDYALQNWLPAFDNEASEPTRIIYKNISLEEETLRAKGGIPNGWKCEDDVPKSFYVEAVTAGATVSMTSNNGPDIKLLYSTDGSTWKDFTVGSTSITLSKAGGKVWFKAGSGGNERLGSYGGYNRFSFSNKVNVGGDITSLISADGGISDLSNYTYTFPNLFRDNAYLISAKELSLSSTILVTRCYYYMFYNCSGLLETPELPATTLASSCYYYMFYGCSKLTKGPVLPAKTLVSSCYYGMFFNCTQLSEVTIKAETLVTSFSYSRPTQAWLQGVKSAAGTIYYTNEAFINDLPKNSDGGIPTGWTATKISN